MSGKIRKSAEAIDLGGFHGGIACKAQGFAVIICILSAFVSTFIAH